VQTLEAIFPSKRNSDFPGVRVADVRFGFSLQPQPTWFLTPAESGSYAFLRDPCTGGAGRLRAVTY